MKNSYFLCVLVLILGNYFHLNAQNISDFYSEISNSNHNKNLVNDYAVDNDFATDDSTALQQAIDDINTNGGGTLYIDAGNYSFESIHLKSNVHIVIDTLAVIKPTGISTKNYAIFNFGNSGGGIENVSIKSNDENGEVVEKQQVLTPSVSTIAGKDIKNRYVIDLSTVENKNITVFRMNNVKNFYLSDFHVIDNYTKFSSIGMGHIKDGGLTNNNIKAELTSLLTNVENAFNKAALNDSDYVNDIVLVRDECYNAIITLLPIENQSNAINYLDILKSTFTTALTEVFNTTITTEEKQELIEEFEGRFQDLVIDLANGAEPQYWFMPQNGVVYNSSSSYAHYGYGLIQVQAAENVFFKDISGDGGATLRLETGLNSMNNVQIGGVDKMYAENVYNQNGNSSVMVSPHSMHNGTVNIKGVSSLSSGFALRVEGGFISKKYNQDIGLTVGTYGSVIVDDVEGVFGNSAQLKSKHDHLIPSELNFDRTDPQVAATTKDNGESVTGPAIVTYLMSANYKCNNNGTENVVVTNVSSIGFDYIGSTLEEGNGEVDCSSLSNHLVQKNKACKAVIKNNIITSNCGVIENLKLYNFLGQEITSITHNNLQHVPGGVYIVKYEIDHVLFTTKIIINK